MGCGGAAPTEDGVSELTVRTIGGPTAVLELGGLRLLVDPTFDAPRTYDMGGGRVLTKTQGPAMSADDIGAIDAVLLSHDQHADNLDESGRAVAAAAPVTYTTPLGASRLGGQAVGMAPWDEATVGAVTITAVPAQHGPDGTEHLTGPVTGFVLHGDELPTVYVSGDNASLDLVRAIADRFPRIDVAVLFAGAARTKLLGDANLTLGSAEAAEAARILGSPEVVPVHCDSWAHFTEGCETVVAAFADAGLTAVLHRPPHGEPVRFGPT
jgi:L-ascorbate metabolism protein UlaG (beta-lactamase superfamily)